MPVLLLFFDLFKLFLRIFFYSIFSWLFFELFWIVYFFTWGIKHIHFFLPFLIRLGFILALLILGGSNLLTLFFFSFHFIFTNSFLLMLLLNFWQLFLIIINYKIFIRFILLSIFLSFVGVLPRKKNSVLFFNFMCCSLAVIVRTSWTNIKLIRKVVYQKVSVKTVLLILSVLLWSHIIVNSN